MTEHKSSRTRPSIFPKYEPNGDDPMEYAVAHFTTLAKRVLLIVSLLGIATTAASTLGFRVFGPQQTADRVKAVEDSLSATNKRVTSLEELVRANIYISCQTLAHTQPAQSIPPQQCADKADK